MDFQGLNEHHKKKPFPETVKLDSLGLKEIIKIDAVRKVFSQKLARRFFLVHISHNRCFFLPARITEYLLQNDDELKELEVLASKGYLSFKVLGDSGMEFIIKYVKKSKLKNDFDIPNVNYLS